MSYNTTIILRFKPFQFLANRLYSSSTISHYLHLRINSFLATSSLSALPSLLQYHAYLISTGHSNNIFIAAKLISLYSFLREPSLSRKVFDPLRLKDTFLWNSIIKAYFSNGEYTEAIRCYCFMQSSNVPINDFTLPMVVTSCAEDLATIHGTSIHGFVLKTAAFNGNSAIGSSFVYMYSKFGCMEDAAVVFDEITMKDVVAWTALVVGYVQNGESEKGLECIVVMHRIDEYDEKPNFRTLNGGFKACGDLGALIEGKCLHGLATKSGVTSFPVIKSSLLSMYSKCGSIRESYLSFSEVPDKDIVSWTSMLGAYARLGRLNECLDLYLEMQAAGVDPDEIAISCVLSGFSHSSRLSDGKAFHGIITKKNILSRALKNALMSMYCKFGQLALAEKLFDKLHDRDKESWNIMVLQYGKAGEALKCIELFRDMIVVDIELDSKVFSSVISSCSRLASAYLGRSVHGYAIRHLRHEHTSIANALIDMYGKSGYFTIASRIFYNVDQDTSTWNALISSYAHNELFVEALSIFDNMLTEGFMPNDATLVSVLSACSHTASLNKGEEIHNLAKDGGFVTKISVATALVDMYAKCGQLEKSREIFEAMQEKDVVSWNVMISGYGLHGDAESSLQIFQKMEHSGMRPNGLTFLAVLSACAHAGLVEEGKSLFFRMRDHSLSPTLKHYACMVDLLGRSGNLQEAEALLLSIPTTADGVLWGALLSACKTHNDPKMGIRIAKHAIEADPTNDGYYVIISDLYTSLGMWQEVERTRTLMMENRIRKNAGWSKL
ncbi:pentatricopeptide repeat-containing protein At4g39952, mitochondrial [Impatiens glandulifera]|uniref:pentatricopeptide repeat-containing protein At4g39952, mitochondrial n=1 Tax=Impatiens glandulifera TaxID=253017 RepID=UPI001FB11F6A|nr:pentatricopeptide repeat-containing protein At4g39952, mitochondrial [Impatiens glandulifera]XP_047328733.1 pentatricopeptide repeat-containing protein At4g39952, mitochondrial [Impatiens glandulifera]XP_047328734.1 pentatricopeptide repeat-containing protein At4g39952, mitochondrial [Impatiens glandulifera]XP_047328735.1 pentatricopeptide repeat-containing protein At4g39952, mitochondrial [Impatiens glandulifera]